MDNNHKKALQKCHEKLCSDLDYKEISKYLYQEEYINADHLDEIKSENNRGAKIDRLLSIIKTRGPNVYSCFIQGLRRSKGQVHLADMLQSEVANLEESKTLRSPPGQRNIPPFIFESGEELESSTRSSLINEERKGKLWVTSHQDSSVEGLVSHKGCIFIVHSAHDRLYVYKCGSLTDSSDIPMMIYPKDMSILTDDVSTKLIIADTSNRLHWITVDDKGAKVVFSTYSMRVHYQPWSLSADNQTQQVVAVDKNKPELHVYNSQGESLTWCNIRGDLSPSSIVSTTKVYGLCDYRRNNMVLMTRNGAFMRRLQAVDQRRGMKPIYMTGGENGGIMVVDAMYNRVLLFSDAGEYICSLIGQQDDFPNIVRVCLDKVHYRLHLAFETKSPDSNSVKTIKILSIDYNELK